MKYLPTILVFLFLLFSDNQEKATLIVDNCNLPDNEATLVSSIKEKGTIKNNTYVCFFFDWNISISKEFDIYYPVDKKKDNRIPLLIANQIDENQLVSFGLNDKNFFSAYIKGPADEKNLTALGGNINNNSIENFIEPSRVLTRDLKNRYSENDEIAFKQNVRNEIINKINYNIYEIKLVSYPEESPIVNQIVYVRRHNNNDIYFSITYSDENFKESLIKVLYESLSAGNSQAQTLDILWEIKNSQNNIVSYIIGVKHTSCADDSLDVIIRNKVFPLLVGADVLIKEPSVGDDLPIEEQMKLIRIPDNQSLKEIFTTKEFELIASFCEQQNVSLDYGLNKLNPVILKEHLMSTFNVEDCKKKKSIESEVQDIAEKEKKEIVFIESSKQALNAYSSMALEKQKSILLEFSKNPTGFHTQKQLYYRDYSVGIEKIFKKEQAYVNFVGGSKFAKSIIQERNLSWLEVIRPILEEKSSFIIVGVGHLGSQRGMINLLRNSNFQLRNIPIELN